MASFSFFRLGHSRSIWLVGDMAWGVACLGIRGVTSGKYYAFWPSEMLGDSHGEEKQRPEHSMSRDFAPSDSRVRGGVPDPARWVKSVRGGSGRLVNLGFTSLGYTE
jgi:hypothetical protein